MVMPGSLDYLYYNGILNSIPYEAYQMSPATYAPMNATQYLNQAKKDYGFSEQMAPDIFIKRNTSDENYYSVGQNSYGETISLLEGDVNKRGNKTDKKTQIKKGLIGLGAIGLTLLLLFRGKGAKAVK